MKKAEIITCITLVLLMFLPTQVQAQQGGKIRFGNLSVIPGIEMQGIYDDNTTRVAARNIRAAGRPVRKGRNPTGSRTRSPACF
jgi:hypothetical protein